MRFGSGAAIENSANNRRANTRAFMSAHRVLAHSLGALIAVLRTRNTGNTVFSQKKIKRSTHVSLKKAMHELQATLERSAPSMCLTQNRRQIDESTMPSENTGGE